MTIYFDNAASSFPKPKPVLEAVSAFLMQCGNPGRGGHTFALEGARRIFAARETLAEFLGINLSKQLVFTPGCTHSINYVLKGLSEKGYFACGDSILTGALEHNAVTRPLNQIKKKHDLNIQILDVQSEQISLTQKPKLVVLNQSSNVTGVNLDLEKICAYCSANDIPLLIDAAQTVGKIDIDLSGKHKAVTFYCASSHKGLLGAPGAGLLYIKEGWQSALDPAITGGTGSRSEDLDPPDDMPDRFEAGTMDGPAICSMAAGLSWMRERGISDILQHELNLREAFVAWASEKSFLHVIEGGYEKYTDHALPHLATVSFLFDGLSSSTVVSKLNEEFQIAVRGGLHCARQAHFSLGSLDQGLVRASFGYSNTTEELEKLFEALQKIANTKSSSN